MPRKGELWTNALSLTRKSSPVSVSSLEPKNASLACISVYVLPICQSGTGHALGHPDKKQALILTNRGKVVGSQCCFLVISPGLCDIPHPASLYTEAGKTAMPILSQKKPTRQRQVKFIT